MVKTPRHLVLFHAKEIAKRIGNQRYSFVKRGAVNWAAFPFDKHRYAMALMVDSTTLFRNRSGTRVGMADMVFSMELMARMPEGTDELSDEISDILFGDAQELVEQLLEAKTSGGDPIIFGWQENANSAVEVHDASKSVQGLIVSLNLQY